MTTRTYAGHATALRHWPGGPGRALLVHCSLAHSGAWKGVAAHLAETHDCRAFDLPGHGRSGPWDRRGVYQDTVCAQMREMIAEWEAPVDLIGHSFGATAALRVAATAPELVRRLVLIEPVFFTVAYQADPAFREAQMQETSEVEEGFRTGDYRRAAIAFLSDWGGGQPWESLTAEQQEGFTEQMKLVEAVFVTNNGDPDGMLAGGLVARLQAPTLLIDGGASPEASHRIVAALDALIPDTHLVTVPGAGHMVPITHADTVGPLVTDFLT
ncbi:hydrolase, alpha/beta fold family protein [Pseudooceanicola batsensis HTCC2597]|uniref:Hydrolase, alpha/beta fold family protein n=1 Tax=Pseudooceanicola batsensis (strain ATCC BAA-863 / DSM 15984 / KCTC 12145 / HTCC2597) TaxID=252305 RepID=A3TTZ2_PSEBH|nr:alpha/beta hydrolase [Pseudooceanicola batsensis]EAQ05119.1 hydrolase, alpha/beta fold family protein [Pseudooceanicola batsensis HTCC2597]